MTNHLAASSTGYRIIRILAFLASLLAAGQIIFSLTSGSILCLNQGCHIVESLTIIPPLYLNIIGFVFFQMIFWSSYYVNQKPAQQTDLLGMLLIAGLAFSSALLAYQIFFVHAFCGYCLLIFGFVFLMNLCYGRKQQVTGTALLSAILFSFSILNFMPTEVFSKFYSLKNAAYGVKSCDAPSKEIFLIFSSDCVHCKNVIQELSNCNSCDLYLNPIDEIDSIEAVDIKLNPDYSPDLNRLILKVLEIDTVPVLISKSQEGYRFIKGEKKIINYVRHACFTQDNVLYLDESLSTGAEEISVITEKDGECSVEIDCEDQ
ncbi:MAG: hypothetical protein JSW04_01290 [Desulfobacterales bacterium]|nr:MAG: hypothetical protein JSW04_01290 [Desulfobacterales bacterium]